LLKTEKGQPGAKKKLDLIKKMILFLLWRGDQNKNKNKNKEGMLTIILSLRDLSVGVIIEREEIG